MTVQPQEQLTTEQVVEAYRTYRRAAVDAMLRTIRAEWAAVRAGTAVADWLAGPALRVFAAIALTQEMLSASSVAFVEDVLDTQGVRAVVPPLVPDAFAGYSQDSGVDLRRVLFTAPDRVDLLRRSGLSDDEALARGLGFLGMVATTETSDAVRSADKVATVAATPTDNTPRTKIGWVRVLTPPSCSRCAILAGRFYRWSSGFERHPNCDCIHLPATVAAAKGLIVDPQAYFESLTPSERTQLFGKANSAAIAAGADMNRVVNAATRGKVRIAADGTRWVNGRRSVWQLIKDSAGDRDEAVRLLTQAGYIRA